MLQIDAAPDEQNLITLTVEPVAGGATRVSVSDGGPAPSAGPGCASDPSGAVVCTVNGLYLIEANLGDGDDSLIADTRDPEVQLTLDTGEGADVAEIGPEGEICVDAGLGEDKVTITTASRSCSVDGQEGNDQLTGSSGYDRLYGGDGADVLDGGDGDDYLHGDEDDDQLFGGEGDDVYLEGGDGNDLVEGGAGRDFFEDGPGDDTMDAGEGDDRFLARFDSASGNDAYLGGTGFDRFVYLCPTCAISLDGAANDGRTDRSEADNVEVERITIPSRQRADDGEPAINYGSGADVLVGDAADNQLVALRGPDRLVGGLGRDRLNAGRGSDRVIANDGEKDALVECGPGTDLAIVDSLDDPRGCERVRVREPAGV